MGNRALLPVLAQLAVDPQFKDFGKFNTVVFAAPDVDRDVFMEVVAAQIHKPATRSRSTYQNMTRHSPHHISCFTKSRAPAKAAATRL